MPHQCTKCSKVFPDASKELLEGCKCGSRFFYYIKQQKYDELKSEVRKVMEELNKADREQIEQDIRELTGLTERPDEPVILDLESVRVLKPGKFEIDIVSLFSKNRPLIYKLGEGKYIIDIASSLGTREENKKRISKSSVVPDNSYREDISYDDPSEENVSKDDSSKEDISEDDIFDEEIE